MEFIKKGIKNKTLIIIFLIIFLLSSRQAHAASLSVLIPPTTYSLDATIPVKILLSNSNMSINAVSVQLQYSKDIVSIKYITMGNAMTMWAQQPTYLNSNGTASIQAVNLDNFTDSTGTIATVYFTALHPGTGYVSINSKNSSVLLSNGLGTNVLTKTSGAELLVNGTTTNVLPTPSQKNAVAVGVINNNNVAHTSPITTFNALQKIHYWLYNFIHSFLYM